VGSLVELHFKKGHRICAGEKRIRANNCRGGVTKEGTKKKMFRRTSKRSKFQGTGKKGAQNVHASTQKEMKIRRLLD